MWSVNCCPENGSGRENCWGGWQMSRSRTNVPDVSGGGVGPTSVATLSADLPNLSLQYQSWVGKLPRLSSVF